MFPRLLRHKKANIQKEAAWTLSNITAGRDTQIQEVINAGVVPYMIETLVRVCFNCLHVLDYVELNCKLSLELIHVFPCRETTKLRKRLCGL